MLKKLDVLCVALKVAALGLLSNETVAIKLIFSCPSAWLAGYEDPVVSRINMRIQDLTGLDVSTAEELQVSNRSTSKVIPASPGGSSVDFLH